MRGGQEEAGGGAEEDGDGGLNETEVQDGDQVSDAFHTRFLWTKEASLLTGYAYISI